LAKVDLGDKQVCPSCGAKFYDLRRRPATCPKCSTSFDPAEEGVRLKRSRSKVATYSDDEEEEVEEKKAEVGDDEEEEEAAEAPGLDKETPEEVVVGDDEEVEPTGDELPPGFSEEEADLEEDAADDALPILEDEEEFPEDEIGEIPADDEEEGGR
jgi:uncharacterized protein (TIGR02300 family)